MDFALFASVVIIHAVRERLLVDEEPPPTRSAPASSGDELISLVTPDNVVLPHGGLRRDMRSQNLWHRATYVLVRHEPEHIGNYSHHPSEVFVIVQKRTLTKDYCPGRFDATPGGVVGFGESYLENAVRELQEEMAIDVCAPENQLRRLFTFPYEDGRVRVWGEFFECRFVGPLRDLRLQAEEVESIERMSLQELQGRIASNPEDFMPDSCYAMQLYFQRRTDLKVNRRYLKGYSSADLDAYGLRPKPDAIFFDCDDCLYFDDWKTAKLLSAKIDQWCQDHGLAPGKQYELYKEYGTALRGLLAEGYLTDSEEAIDAYLKVNHDLPIHELLKKDEKLRDILLRIDPTIPKYIFTASVKEHAQRCAEALGIADLFVDIIDCKRCDLETKHSRHAFEVAMRVAGVTDPQKCLFLDDSVKNMRAANEIGWRTVLVGLVSRDTGETVSSEHAELEIAKIHDIVHVLPELFDQVPK